MLPILHMANTVLKTTNQKTHDSKLVIPNDVKELFKLPMFHGVKRSNVKLPTNVLETYLRLATDGSVVNDPKSAYNELIAEFNKAMDAKRNTSKRQIVFSARTVNGYQLLFVYFVYPIPHVPGAAVTYTSVVYQTTAAEELYRLSGWSVFLEDDCTLSNHVKLYKDLHTAITTSGDLFNTFRNQVLSFDKGTVVRLPK